MKLAIVGKNKGTVAEYTKLLKKNGEYSATSPDIVISLGGDGTFLHAERLYPGVPKLLVRDESICVKCEWDSFEAVVAMLRAKKFVIETHHKLEAAIRRGKKSFRKLCTNDFSLRNKFPIYCIRFEAFVNGRRIDGAMIGDGAVVATPFGSTAYYHSISGTSFKKGMGIAFNNLVKKVPHLVVGANARIRIRILRGTATFSADNDPETISLREGDSVKIKRSSSVAKIIGIRK